MTIKRAAVLAMAILPVTLMSCAERVGQPISAPATAPPTAPAGPHVVEPPPSAADQAPHGSIASTRPYPATSPAGVLGERFVPTDVDWEHPVYETSFDSPAALDDWKLEGGQRMSVADGNLVLESQPDQPGNHLVCWLTKEMPADFLLEFTVRPEDRHRGLNIVFFNARGLHGKSIFDPSLRPRNGGFSQYHSGDINCYHVSYWAAGRGTSNCRKNKGFHLVATGQDLVETGPADAFQIVRLYKRGGKIRLMIDDIVSVAYDDDGRIYGPVHTHSGWLALRQMGHTHRCMYEYVRVYPLAGQVVVGAGPGR